MHCVFIHFNVGAGKDGDDFNNLYTHVIMIMMIICFESGQFNYLLLGSL